MALQHRRDRHRIGRMQIDQRAERLGALPERRERRMVEILAVGVAVDHGAAEFQLPDAALELVGGGLGVLHRQMREAGIAVRPLLDFLGQEIVGRLARCGSPSRCRARPARRGRRAPARRARCRPCPSRRAAARRNRCSALSSYSRLAAGISATVGIPVFDEARAQEMLFERDFLDHAFLPAVAFPRSVAQLGGPVYHAAPNMLEVGIARVRRSTKWRRKFVA